MQNGANSHRVVPVPVPPGSFGASGRKPSIENKIKQLYIFIYNLFHVISFVFDLTPSCCAKGGQRPEREQRPRAARARNFMLFVNIQGGPPRSVIGAERR